MPVSAQSGEIPVQLPDGSFVLPGQEELPGDSETQDDQSSNQDTKVQDFVSGVGVGVAVGFVGGALIAWFLKPGNSND